MGTAQCRALLLVRSPTICVVCSRGAGIGWAVTPGSGKLRSAVTKALRVSEPTDNGHTGHALDQAERSRLRLPWRAGVTTFHPSFTAALDRRNYVWECHAPTMSTIANTVPQPRKPKR